MKKILFLLMLVTIVSLTSCNKQNDHTDGNYITFNLSPDEEYTRTASYRFILEIYEGTDVSSIPVHHIEQHDGHFTVSLRPDTEYICLFWADYGTAYDNTNGSYNATSLQDVKLNDGKEMGEAFFANKAILVTNTSISNNITLKRAISKINLVETDVVEPNINLKVDYSHYTSFNTSNGEVIGSKIELSRTFIPTETTGILGTLLSFASVNGIEIDFIFTFGTEISNNVPNVLLKANSITNIRGKYGVQINSSQKFDIIEDRL